jgi:hypothetical protein
MAAFAFSATCYTVRMNSRAKGKRAELEAALLLTQMGLKSRRSAQYCGSNGDADLVLDANLHVEVKFQEQMHPYRWMEQDGIVRAQVADTHHSISGTESQREAT